MKKLLVIVLAVLMVLSIVACSAAPAAKESAAPAEEAPSAAAESAAPAEEETAAAAGEKEQVKVAFVFDILDVNQQDHADHIRYQLELINEEQDTVEFTDFTGFNCNMDNEKFITDMESAVTAGYNLIFSMPVDSVGAVPAYEAATKAGVKVVDLRGVPITDQVSVMYQGIGEAQLAQCTKEYVKGLLEADPELVLNTCLVYPTAGHTGSFVRLDVIKELAEEMPGRINVLVEGYGNWRTEDTQKLVEDWIQTYQDINYIQCANDEEALGAINALEAAGMKEGVMVLGGNGAMQGTDLIIEGRLDATAGQDKPVFARNLAELAVKLYDGTYTELAGYDDATKVYLPEINAVAMVTPDNAEQRKEDLLFYEETFAAYR